jgi:hypothetical protein
MKIGKIKLTTEQVDILKINGWEFGENTKSFYAINIKKTASIYGDLVGDFLKDESEELLSGRYNEVDNITKVIKEKGYTLISFEPLKMKHKSGELSEGACAHWLLRELIKY